MKKCVKQKRFKTISFQRLNLNVKTTSRLTSPKNTTILVLVVVPSDFGVLIDGSTCTGYCLLCPFLKTMLITVIIISVPTRPRNWCWLSSTLKDKYVMWMKLGCIQTCQRMSLHFSECLPSVVLSRSSILN